MGQPIQSDGSNQIFHQLSKSIESVGQFKRNNIANNKQAYVEKNTTYSLKNLIGYKRQAGYVGDTLAKYRKDKPKN